MNKNFMIDYLGCILFKLCSPIIRRLPLGFSFFLGRCLGDLFYYFDLRHRAIAHANIRTAFCAKLTPQEQDALTRKFYRAFGQNLIEIFLIPLADRRYLKKYVAIEGLDYISEAFKKGKGVIFLGMHEGSWEFSNIVAANLGIPYNLFVRQQRLPRLNNLINFYRRQKGCRIIERENQTRRLIHILKSNQAVGMSVDQGGRLGEKVKFFAKTASMSSGPLKLAFKYDTVILPVFSRRIKGPYIKFVIKAPFEIIKTGGSGKDLSDNLKRLIYIFEEQIAKYPYEYLWSYKVWKYSDERKILILSDGKTGHLRQAEATAKIIDSYFKDKGINSGIDTVEIKLKNKFSRYALTLRRLGKFLDKTTFNSLIRLKPDVVISAGSPLAPFNLLLSRFNLAKSVVIMKPPVFSQKHFDLVIMPKHDRPDKRKNVAVTDGALNLVDEDYLKEQADKLRQASRIPLAASRLYIGLLIGGNTKNFKLSQGLMRNAVNQVKASLDKLDAHILVSSSRRTPAAVEQLLEEEFKDYPRCISLIIANKNNFSSALGGILGLSQVVITSPESISMISEAANSRKYVVVFNGPGLSPKHKRFLDYFREQKYIYLAEAGNLSRAVEDIWLYRPTIYAPNDNLAVSNAIKNIL